MQIRLSDVGKRFNREWIFKDVTLTFAQPSCYAIIGPNGSGKSTLLQTIGGLLQPSKGQVEFSINGIKIAPEKTYQYISFCAPYLELIEEMTLVEFLNFHQSFKKPLLHINVSKIISEIGLETAAQKQIRHFSSGMKQRVKLAQALFTDTPVVLLDEPGSNLDAEGFNTFRRLLETYCKDRIVIISSNDPQEYEFISPGKISITEYKNA